jgi:glutathione S-transferase
MSTRQSGAPEYELYYWPTIQGRGEFVRLALEAARARYVDVARLPAREGGGERALMRAMKDAPFPPFAPPFLRHKGLVVAQTANILLYVAPRHGLVPRDEASRLRAHQLQLTIADVVAEAHDTHHPIAASAYYEDQKREASRRAGAFVKERIPKYLGYFERVLDRQGGAHLVGRSLSYVDLSMFQLLEGLTYAFPRAMRRQRVPRLRMLARRVAAYEPVAEYLASERRLPFSEEGIFRHYAELDAA